LIAALKEHSHEAFSYLVSQNAAWMLGLARRILLVDNLASDCVQEAFLKAYSNIKEFEHRSSIKTWLHRIVVNQALMKNRTLNRQAEEPYEDYLPTFDKNGFLVGPINIEKENVEDILSKKQNAMLVQQAIHSLPDNFRIMLLLRDIEQLSTSEVAEILEVEASVVRSRIHRARIALRKKLEPLFQPRYLNDL